MTRRTLVIVPPTVPRATVAQVPRPATPVAPVATADTRPVATPTVRPLAPQQLTDDEIARLMEENHLLRDTLAQLQQRR